MAAVDSPAKVGLHIGEIPTGTPARFSATEALVSLLASPKQPPHDHRGQHGRDRGGTSLEDRFQDVVLNTPRSGTFMNRWVTRRLSVKVIPAASAVTTLR